MIKLHVLRHGQAFHNLAASTSPAEPDSPQFKDCLLTPLGENQARASQAPLISCNAQFWVSPLRRAIQTASLALPHVTKWYIVEDLRERAGRKYCDSRLKRSELLEWVHKTYGEEIEWDSESMSTEEDTLFDMERENSYRMRLRVMSLLRRILTGRECTEFVWVSHSGLLSILCCVLHLLPIEERWLANGQWRSFQLDRKTIESAAREPTLPMSSISTSASGEGYEIRCHLEGQVRPSVSVKGVQPKVADAVHPERIFAMEWDEWSLEKIDLNSRELIIIDLEVSSSRCKLIDSERLGDMVRDLRVKLPLSFKKEETPPFVLNGTSLFRVSSSSSGGDLSLDFTRIGISHGADLLILASSTSNLDEKIIRISSLMIKDGGLRTVTIMILIDSPL